MNQVLKGILIVLILVALIGLGVGLLLSVQQNQSLQAKLDESRAHSADLQAQVNDLQAKVDTLTQQLLELAGNPVTTVRDMFNAVSAKQFDRIVDFACAAKKDEIAQQFNFGQQLAGVAEGLDAQQILDAMNIAVEGMEFTEVSRSGNEATVNAKGTLKITVDPAKFRDVMRAILEAQGMTGLDDASIDQFATSFTETFERGTEIDQNFELVNEGGRWLICGP